MPITTDKVTLVFTTSGSSVSGLCKIGMFMPTCKDYSASISEDAWSGGTFTYDLLKDTMKTRALPSLTITPDSCYTTTWQLYYSNGALVNNPTVFNIDSVTSNLVITHPTEATFTNVLSRVMLAGVESYYFLGTTDTSSPSTSSNFAFNIEFKDGCLTTTIAPKAITLSPVKLDESKSQLV